MDRAVKLLIRSVAKGRCGGFPCAHRLTLEEALSFPSVQGTKRGKVAAAEERSSVDLCTQQGSGEHQPREGPWAGLCEARREL